MQIKEFIENMHKAFPVALLGNVESWVGANVSYITDENWNFMKIETDEAANLAVLNLSGIVGYSITNNLLENALEEVKSKNIKNILLNINSPGGSTIECWAIDDTLKDFKEKNPEVRTTAYIGQYGASAGYMLAARCDEIYANKSAITGSIGTIRTVYNFSKYNEKNGIEVLTFKSGKWKAFPDSNSTLSDEDKNKLKASVEEAANEFFNRVSECRSLSIEEIQGFEGAEFKAKDALAMKLIDGICSMNECKKMITNSKISPLLNVSAKAFSREVQEVSASVDQTLNLNGVTNEINGDQTLEMNKPNDPQQNTPSQAELELAQAKNALIEDYVAAYQKATGESCPDSKKNILGKLSLMDIRSEIQELGKLSKQRYASAQVAEENKGEPETKKEQDELNAQITYLDVFATSRKRRSDFDYAQVKNQLVSSGGIQ